MFLSANLKGLCTDRVSYQGRVRELSECFALDWPGASRDSHVRFVGMVHVCLAPNMGVEGLPMVDWRLQCEFVGILFDLTGA